MKILVPIKRVPDYEMKVKILPSGEGIQTDGIKWIVNPFDEIAVEEALKIKESGAATEVVVVTIGPSGAAEQLRSALAMGADRAILVVTDQPVDSDAAARALAAVCGHEQYGLIILGKQSIDSDANQTGQLLAAALNWPQATFASKVSVTPDGSGARVTREVDGGLETIDITLPGIITTDLRLNTPRYTTLPNIVKAKKKPLEEIPFDTLGVSSAVKVKVRKLSIPPARQAGVKVQSVSELVEKLKNEAKVL